MKRLLTVAALLLTTAICSAQDRIDDLAKAIAKAEGCYIKGTIPNRYHNCGDLKLVKGWRYPGQVGVGKGGHVIFKNDKYGWEALRHQIEKIIAGDSKFYNVNLTIKQLGKKYATSSLWAKNVAHNLGATPTTELWEALGVPPMLEKNWSRE